MTYAYAKIKGNFGNVKSPLYVMVRNNPLHARQKTNLGTRGDRKKAKRLFSVFSPFCSVLGTRNNLAVKVRYRLGSRNC